MPTKLHFQRVWDALWMLSFQAKPEMYYQKYGGWYAKELYKHHHTIVVNEDDANANPNQIVQNLEAPSYLLQADIRLLMRVLYQ